jgi:transcriptional regulator with PAS, ATPase and Fis domain
MDNEALLMDLNSVLGPYPMNPLIARALRFCFKNPYEGLMIVDTDGIIQFMDRPSEEFLGLEPGGARGRSIKELVPKSDFELVMKSGTPVIGRIREIGGIMRMASVYPLKKDGVIIGAIGRRVFYPYEEIEKRNKEIQDLKNEVQYLRQKEKTEYSSVYTFDNILGSSTLMRDTIATAKRISTLDTDVLIVGETGTGKELFAHSIHGFRHSDKPFAKINCPAIPFELAESQLFGYEKGSFTGASSSGRAGIFESANNGIVFLDEISSLPLSLQAKLLRVLQEREIQRLGSTKTKKVNFRFIAATSVDLLHLVEKGEFRHDLYYRVAGATLDIPPLRDRREDIPLYLYHFLETINKSFNIHLKGFSSEARDILFHYDWPGNVRQLIHVLEQTAIHAWDAEEIISEHLPKELVLHEKRSFTDILPGADFGMKQEMAQKEKNSIVAALKQTRGNKRQAAILLKMPRSTFYQKIRRYDIG